MLAKIVYLDNSISQFENGCNKAANKHMSSKFGLKSYLQFPLSSIIIIYQMGAIECLTYLLTNH